MNTSLHFEPTFDGQLQEWLDDTTEQFERLDQPDEQLRDVISYYGRP